MPHQKVLWETGSNLRIELSNQSTLKKTSVTNFWEENMLKHAPHLCIHTESLVGAKNLKYPIQSLGLIVSFSVQNDAVITNIK